MRTRATTAAVTLTAATVALAVLASPALAGKSAASKPSKTRTATTTVVTSPSATPTATATPVVEPVVETVVAPVVEPVVETVTAVAEPTPTASAAPATTNVDAQALPLLARPTLVNPKTVWLTPLAPVITLDYSTDYVVRVDANAVFRTGAAIVGGRNVVLENATIRYDGLLGTSIDTMVRGLFLKSQTGVMWVNGLQIRGPLKEGIQLDQKAPGAAVVLQNVAVDPVTGTYAGWHADLLQTWAGPAKLVVDNFTGTSDYQGMFLRPNQLWADGPKPEFFWLRNVSLDVSTGYYALWSDGYGAFPLQTTDVTVKANNPANRDAWLWPKPSTGDTTWSQVLGVG